MEPQLTQPQLYRVESAASILGVSHWTVRAWVKKGRVKTVRLGKLRMVPKAEIDRIAQDGLETNQRKSREGSS